MQKSAKVPETQIYGLKNISQLFRYVRTMVAPNLTATTNYP